MATTGHESEIINVERLKDTLQKFKTDKVDVKSDKSSTVSNVSYDGTNKKFKKTINGSTTDIVELSTLKSDMQLSKSDVGLGNVGNFKAVSTEASQGLSDTEKSNARSNLGLGSAATKDVPSSGNASDSQVVMGNDSRLTNSRPASDVSAWAKAASKPSYNLDEIGDGTNKKWGDKLGSNEAKVIAAAMNEVGAKVIETTWATVKALRDCAQLIPGMWYQITDYECTTTQEDTRAVSNNFDILVFATGVDSVSEIARAKKKMAQEVVNVRLYKTDRYEYSDKVDYTDYFLYAGTMEYDRQTYYMWRKYEQDEETEYYALTETIPKVGSLELPDDGDNYLSIIPISPDGKEYGHEDDVMVEAEYYEAEGSGDYFADANLDAWELLYSLDNDKRKFYWADKENGKGVIYFMRDEWGNECPYDFKNIQFKRYRADAGILDGLFVNRNYSDVDMETAYWCYTFCMIDTSNNSAHDVSVEQNKYLSDEGYKKTTMNTFKPYYNNWDDDLEKKVYSMWLPDNVFVTDTDLCSIEESYGEFYGYHYNNFGDDCFNNTIGNCFYHNTIGIYFQNNSIGNDFNNNSIGNYFLNNSIGNGSSSNSIGDSCQNNSIGNGSSSNSIGNYFHNNSIGNGSSSNSIGDSCEYNIIGNKFCGNTIGNDFNNNSIGNYFQNNSIGNSCHYIRIQKDYVYYVIIENGNQYIDVTSTKTTSSSSTLCNFTIAQGVNNTSTRKTISHNSVNDTFKTTYQPTNSQVVSV